MNIKIWELSCYPANKSPVADWDDGVDLEQILCPLNPGHMRGGKRIGPLKVVLRTTKLPDFVWGWGSDLMLQDHVYRAFRKEGFTGFEVRKAYARFKRATGQVPPPLWEFVTTGWGGMAPPESGVRLLENCPGCGHLHYAGFRYPEKMFDPRQWDGSDFFMIWPYPNFIFITERVHDFILSSRFTGASLVPIENLNPYPTGAPPGSEPAGASPGRLSYSMSEARAHELGDRLGIF